MSSTVVISILTLCRRVYLRSIYLITTIIYEETFPRKYEANATEFQKCFIGATYIRAYVTGSNIILSVVKVMLALVTLNVPPKYKV